MPQPAATFVPAGDRVFVDLSDEVGITIGVFIVTMRIKPTLDH